MKKPILILLLLAFVSFSKAQSIDTVKNSTSKTYFVEDKPAFPGGLQMFIQFIAKNVQYPATAFEKHEHGKVYVQFVIAADGAVTNATIVRSVSPSLDTEALRVIRLSPKWRPGLQNGKAVAVNFTVPITFNLGLSAQKTDTTGANTDTTILQACEIEPQFPKDGIAGFYHFLQKNLKYKTGDGLVRISFIVEKDGSLTNINIVRSAGPERDAECIRLIKICPKWIPGIQDGKPVRIQYTIPIAFGNN